MAKSSLKPAPSLSLFCKICVLVGISFSTAQSHADFRPSRGRVFGHSQPPVTRTARPISQSPHTRTETISANEGLMRPGRWAGTVFQYPDTSGNFHAASRALVAASDGSFKQTIGGTLQTVEYNKNDVLFYVEGLGWHKSRAGSGAPPPATANASPRAPEKSSPGNSFENEVIRLVNGIRRRAGLSALQPVGGLMDSALNHTRWMARTRRLKHTTANVAENIAVGQSTPSQVVNSWMNSSGHRKNILNPNYKITGVAAVADASGRLYWGQQFLF
jgi:uncharacterized protein YkwD